MYVVLFLILITGSRSTHAFTDFPNLFHGFARLDVYHTLTGVPYQASANPFDKGYAYYGIKYGHAERFEDSVMNTDFSYLGNTSIPKQGYTCPQVSPKLSGSVALVHPPKLNFSEDCLFLDVYVPPLTMNQRTPFPVMLWIYGGAFMSGSKDRFNATLLSASIKVIVVTFNYRVGAFGFSSTLDNLTRGNWGLGDAKLALEWTRRNIASFGGNPDKITIFGESAGGCLTSAMMLDDNVRGTVQAAIAMSGSTVASWMDYTQTALATINDDANFLGCPTDPLDQTISCMKSRPFESFIAPRNDSNRQMNLRYGPVVDGVHIKGHPLESITQSQKSLKRDATFVNGYLKQDMSFIINGEFPQVFASGFNYSVFREVLSAYLPQSPPCPEQQQGILDNIEAFYNVSQTDDEETLRQKLFVVRRKPRRANQIIVPLITTDLRFAYTEIKESIAYASRNFSDEVPNYHYTISYDPGYRGWGAFHTLDVILIFRGPSEILMSKIQPSTEEATKSIRDFLRQLAYTGRLNSTSFASNQSVINLNGSGRWEMSSEDFQPLLKFWDTVSAFQCT